MLTREEYKIIINKINKSTGHGTIANAMQYFIECLLELTEKPKREIQIGEVYHDDDEDRKLRHITGSGYHNTCMSSCGYFYSLDGKYAGDCDMPDLDMSKRYKLVEIKDVD